MITTWIKQIGNEMISVEQDLIVPIMIYHFTKEMAEYEMAVGHTAHITTCIVCVIIFQMKQHLHRNDG